MQRRLAQRGAVVTRELEHDFLDVVEAGVRARIRRVGDAEAAGGEAEGKRRVEVGLVPDLVARATEA